MIPNSRIQNRIGGDFMTQPGIAIDLILLKQKSPPRLAILFMKKTG